MYKKALVAIDGSKTSLKAIATAKELLDKGALQSFSLINVIPFPPNSSSISEFGIYSIEYQEKLTESAKELMQKALNKAVPDIEAEKHTEFGPPAEVIIQTAEDGDYDLIIIGNRGLNQIKRLLMGSVSTSLVALAHCAVLVVKL